MRIAHASWVLVVLSLPSVARAAIGLAYEAPDGCPSQRDFVDAVAARDASFESPAPTGAHRVMVVAIRRQGDGFTGEFQVRDGETATNKREVQGASCAEVVDALAVVTAIALRPEAATPPAQSTPPPPLPPAPPPATQLAEPRLRGTTFVRRHAHESVAVPAGNVSFDLARSINLYAGPMTGVAPSTVLPRLELSMTVGTFVTTPDGSQRIVGPFYRARLFFLGPGSYSTSTTKTNIDAFGSAFGACLAPHYDSAGLVFLGCFDAGLGGIWLLTSETGKAPIPAKFETFGLVGIQLEALYNLTSGVNLGIKVGADFYAGQPPWSAEDANSNQIFAAPSNVLGYVMLGIGHRF